MSDPSASANGLTLDITSDDPGIAYSREAYAEVCRLRAENESLREALKPFADMCDEIESCAAEYPADHPASDPENWFTGSFEWPALLRAKALYEGEIK